MPAPPPVPPLAWPPAPADGPQDIEILDVTSGAAIRFPYEASRVDRFRAAFRRAHWQRALRCWYLRGVRAARRLEAWRALEYNRHGFDPWAAAKARDAREFDAPPLAPRPTSLPAKPVPEPPRLLLWSPVTQTWYPGRRLTMDEWLAVIEEVRGGVRSDDGYRAVTGREIAQEARRQAYAETGLRRIHTRAEAELMSDLCPLDAMPAIGTEIVKDGRRCAYVALGRVVTITPWHVGKYGPDLLMHVGQKGRFVQWALIKPVEMEQ